MPFGWRAGVAALLAALLVAGFFVSDWLVVAVVLTVLVLAVAYAARALAQGQSDVLRMRHRLDTCRVDRLQRVDQREYRVELAADVAGGVGVEVDAGETRKARHVVGGEAHRRFGALKKPRRISAERTAA